ncbi:MAG: shikimate dehydrogenase [Hyphomicrobiales bacterium]|nr:shikimate dehydrogenase [Hyphomicrobiales bacterium]MDE2016632.1 shikimate dehydrogenase [Hyphomicrobiales bacterium]
MTATKRAFVMGHPIAHSRSPMLHGHWLKAHGIDGAYEKLDVAPADLAAFFAGFDAAGWVGGNVTVPHKSTVIPFLGRLDEAAKAMGAVNTLWWDGRTLVGGNTDAIGFIGNLDDRAPGWDGGAKRATILGAGGAARAAIYGLRARGLDVAIVNRTAGNAQELVDFFGAGVTAHGFDALPDLLSRSGLLVNATSLGMQGKPPLAVDLGALPAAATVCDIVYVPLETELLRAAKSRGNRAVDGLGMLLHQAVEGFRHWFGATPKVTEALRAELEADIRAKSPGA